MDERDEHLGADDVAETPIVWDGRYRIVRTLGEGGMGRVVLARDTLRGDANVAVKILLPEYLDTIAEFLHEYAVQRRLNHPGIPRALELGFANQPQGSIPYFAMEYCRGVPLLSAMRRAPTIRRACDAIAGLLRALDHLHRAGYIHGDVKPGNVLVADDGQELATWLIDLGVAAPIGGFTDAEIFVGTPEYASPELMLGVGVDERADLYAVGLILYELIEGRRPWAGSDEGDLLRVRRAGPPPPLSNPDCPLPLAELVRDLLQPEPHRRPESAGVALERLADALGAEMPIESPRGFIRRLLTRSHPAEAAMLSTGRGFLDGLGVDHGQGVVRALVVEGEAGRDAGRLAALVADRAALIGARVLRVRLPDEPDATPMSALTPVIDVVERLYPELLPLEARTGPVRAARALAAVGRPFVLFVEGLERADAESVSAIFAAITRSTTRFRLLATVVAAPDEELPVELANLLAAPETAHTVLDELSEEALATWMDDAVGDDVVRGDDRDAALAAANGKLEALIQGLHDLFRRGRIIREARGYAPGVAWTAEAPVAVELLDPTGRVGEVDALLACVTQPIAERPLRVYLGAHADALTPLVVQGLLRARDDGTFAVDNEARRAVVYGRLAPSQRRRLHRRLAIALEESRTRDHERVAREYMASDTPLLAVPHLAAAARRAPSEGRAHVARGLLDQAAEILETRAPDGGGSLDLWRFWSLLWRADAQVALDVGDTARFDYVVEQLFHLGTEMGHRQTLKNALEFRLVVDERKRDWHRMLDDAGALLALDPTGPTADALARLRRAKALRYRAEGASQQAIEHLQRALDDGDKLSSEVLLQVLASRARVFVDMQWHHEANEAVMELLEAARRHGSYRVGLEGRALRATLLRLSARPDEALVEVRGLVKELEGERTPGVDGLIEWELACCHLEFGWFQSAREHAVQAQVMASDDGDEQLRLRAMLVEASAALALGARDEAWRIASRAQQLAGPDGDDSDRVNARLLAMGLAVDVLKRAPLEDLVKEVSEIGWRSQKRQEGARAARAFSLAARAAIARQDAALAVQFAQLALKAIEQYAVEHVHRPRHLALLAEAYALHGQDQQAEWYRERARAELERIAGRIGSSELQRAWLLHPAHRALGGAESPLLTAKEPRSPTGESEGARPRRDLKDRIRALVGLEPRSLATVEVPVAVASGDVEDELDLET
ncbi:MAG: serine/threonine protein kinase [Myxococcales bacterium]|nr:serine/threonine protein kinase [Myxococcales bacterium]MCB9732877.1 serine/threonine protein kinase [Deltaproteobacteria bacterium]